MGKLQRFTILSTLVLLSARVSLAVTPTPVPCSPMTIVGPQGRPLANATVAITNPSTGSAVTAYTSAEGTTQFNGVVPATGVLQFYAATGVYTVSVNGQGVNRTYATVCGDAIPPSGKIISISRNAENMLAPATGGAVLQCPDNDICRRYFQDTGTEEIAHVDFILPSFTLSKTVALLLSGTVLSGELPEGSIKTFWEIDWCSYAEGAAVCFPTGANAQTALSSTITGLNKRVDVSFTLNTTDWDPTDHVVMSFKRRSNSGSDTLADLTFALENARYELYRTQ